MYEINNSKLKPLLKWVGGKSKLLGTLEPYFVGTYKTYIETFIGGAAVFIRFNNIAEKWIISDLNRDLIHFYIMVKDEPSSLMKEIDRKIYTNSTKEGYYRFRKRYNDKKISNDYDIEFAALFLYLNKHAFNGIYRVNSDGLFNVPCGAYPDPTLYDKSNLLGWSELLKQGIIKCCDYKEILALAKKGDFIYLDPPYDRTFNDYNEELFDQKTLRDECDKLIAKDIMFIQSNSKTDNIKLLYMNYAIDDIVSWDSLGSNGDSRKKREEVIIRRR
jgi:DNA adenine methylase